MKANNGTGNNVDRDDWETPQWLFNILNNQYNFKFDCCAIPNNNKCDYHFNDFLLVAGMPDIAWMNPPFSKAKEMFEHFFKIVTKGVAIFRCDNMETKIWQETILKNANWIFIFNKRIVYEHHTRKSIGSRFPSALIGIGVEPPKKLQGRILYLK